MATFTFGAMLNNANSTITQPMTVSTPAFGGTLSVTDGSVFSSKGYALIDSELIHYDSVAGNVLTLNTVDGRGAGGTTIAAHVSSTTIYADIRVAAHINELVAGAPNRVLTTKGDLLVASAVNVPSRLGVGTNGQVVFADSTTATGLKYATAPTPAFQALISDQTLTSAIYYFDFLSIPQTYKHLMLVLVTRCDTAAVNAQVTYLSFNGDGATNYDAMATQINKTGLATTEALGLTAGRITDQPASLATANNFSASTIYIPDYTSTSKFKSFFGNGGLNRDLATDYHNVDSSTALWKSTAAINRITILTAAATNFIAGSRATLFGLQ